MSMSATARRSVFDNETGLDIQVPGRRDRSVEIPRTSENIGSHEGTSTKTGMKGPR